MKSGGSILLVWLLTFSSLGFCAEGSSHMNRFHELMDREFEDMKLFASTGKIKFGHGIASAVHMHDSTHHWLEKTPSQPQGPFYPVDFPFDTDNDLISISGYPPALGTVVYIQGQVMDQSGEVLAGAEVEIWQACASGKYMHPHDQNPAKIDPNFQYYGRAISDAHGKYMFKTIIPGPYPANDTWWRPEHIHMMVSKDEYKPLTTQLYFDGSSFPNNASVGKYNSTDLILQSLTEEQQKQLIVSFIPREELDGDRLGVFNIYLERD